MLDYDADTYKVKHECDAIYGIIQLVHKLYFITVLKSEKVADIMGCSIFKAIDFDFFMIH